MLWRLRTVTYMIVSWTRGYFCLKYHSFFMTYFGTLRPLLCLGCHRSIICWTWNVFISFFSPTVWYRIHWILLMNFFILIGPRSWTPLIFHLEIPMGLSNDNSITISKVVLWIVLKSWKIYFSWSWSLHIWCWVFCQFSDETLLNGCSVDDWIIVSRTRTYRYLLWFIFIRHCKTFPHFHVFIKKIRLLILASCMWG